MSVQAVFPVIQRPWKGYEDPGLPVGMWVAQGTVTGDMSGGSQDIFFVFKGEGEPLGARYYNLEQLEIHHTSPVNRQGSLHLNNFDIVGTTGLVNRQIHFNLLADNVTDSSLRTGDVRLPIFVGRPQLVDLEAQIQCRLNNITTEVLFCTGQGYIWEPRSLLTDGGLRRPLDSLYG